MRNDCSFICLYNVRVVFGEHEDSRSNESDDQSGSEECLRPILYPTNDCVVFQHKSDVFRLIDVMNGVIFYFQTNFLQSLI